MKNLLITLLLLSAGIKSFSQGCSDAGFCSLDVLKGSEKQIAAPAKNNLDFGTTFGIGEQNTLTINPYIQYGIQLTDRFSVAGKLTSTYANGDLGQTFDIGDFYGLGTLSLKHTEQSGIGLLAGFKIPLNSANTKNAGGKPLPLDYQSSIGTYDFIAGINYRFIRNIELNAGLQLPVVQVNKSSFFPDEHPGLDPEDFPPTNNFKRKSDVLLRAGYFSKLSESVNRKPNLLAIYHLGKDSYETRLGNRTSIPGSDGLTVNGGLALSKHFKNESRIEFLAATPFSVRKVRPDGLTRKAAASIQYSISF